MLDLKKEGMKFYSDWWENEGFAKEKARKITVKIPLEFPTETLNKTWNEANKMGELLSAAEYLQVLWLHYQKTKEYLHTDYWSWTSSRSSDGRLVCLGCCASRGASVRRGGPGYSYSRLGVVHSSKSKSVSLEPSEFLVSSDLVRLETKIDHLTELFEKHFK